MLAMSLISLAHASGVEDVRSPADAYAKARQTLTIAHEFKANGQDKEAEAKVEAALRLFERATKARSGEQPLSNDNLSNLYLIRGALFLDLERPQEAIRDFTAPLDRELAPDRLSRGFFLYFRSRAHLMARNFDAALGDIQQALSIGGSRQYIYQRARVYVGLERTAEAFADFDRLVELDPNDPKWIVFRGMYRESLGNVEAAKTDYLRAYNLGPQGREMIEKLNKGRLIGKNRE